MKRMIAVLVALGLTASIFATTGAAAPVQGTQGDGKMDIDAHNLNHLSYPATTQADEFMSRQEQLGQRPQTAAEGGNAGYGRKGCTPDKKYEEGDERQFWVSQQQAGNTQIDAVLASKSKHGYIWVQKEFYLGVGVDIPEGGFVTKSEADKAAKDWDKIYAIDRRYFGKEPNPKYNAVNLAPGLPKNWRDADCDPRVHILNFPIDAGGTSLSFIAGYFSSEHEYPNGNGENESPFSNEAEMFFMNSLLLDVGDDTYNGVLAHEFFHMIQFSNDYNEETWVNEGMADVAAVVNNFGSVVDGHIEDFEEEPDQSLVDWTSTLGDYGQAFLLFDYLFNKYGAKEDKSTKKLEAYLPLARILTKTKADGIEGITKVLRKRSAKLESGLARYFRRAKFQKVYKDWLIANYLDDPKLNAGQFGYNHRDVKVEEADGEETQEQSDEDTNVFPYGADYHSYTGKGRMAAEYTNPIAIIPATEGQPAPEGGFFGWGNRGDEMLTFLERPADLTGATTPQLDFKYWYLIEEDWDYTYVRVSTDGGKTYQMLNTSECGGRATDPNGNNRAITESGGITGDSEGWQTCTLDLAEFAGEKVLVRFEYDTDQAVTEPGYVVDNLKLTDGDKVIWKEQNFEKRSATKAFDFGGDGIKEWLRIKPLAGNKPLMQVLRLKGDTLKRLVLRRSDFTKGGLGLRLKPKAKVGGAKTVVIYSATTPRATTPFDYKFGLQR